LCSTKARHTWAAPLNTSVERGVSILIYLPVYWAKLPNYLLARGALFDLRRERG
jgi:hypothetical protein